VTVETRPGTEITPYVMGEIEMERVHAVMEVMRDVNPVHDDVSLVEKRGLRGPVNQGPANLSYVVNMLHAWAGPDLFLERFDFTFREVVIPGDVVTARGTVVSEEQVEGGRRLGCDVSLELADGTVAIDGQVRILLPAPGAGT
jgi:acyl dehydratase